MLNEEGTVVSWELTDFTSQEKMEPVFNDAKFKLKNNQISDIYTEHVAISKTFTSNVSQELQSS